LRVYELVEETDKDTFMHEVNHWASEGYAMYRYYKDGMGGLYTAIMEYRGKSFTRQ
jgi:hypothetical protein